MAIALLALGIISTVLSILSVALLWLIFAALTDTKTVPGTLSKAQQLIRTKVSFISPTKLKDMLDIERELTK